MRHLKLLLLAIALLSTSAASAAGDENACDMNTLPCKFTIHAGMGRHMDLINIAQGAVYTCDLHGLAAIGNYQPAPGLKVSAASPLGGKIDLDASELKENPGYLKFDAENYSDIPYDEVLTCQHVN